MAKRDKKIEIRVSSMELYQIKKHFGKENVSNYVRNHLLEISSDSAIDTTNEDDIFAMFQYFLQQDETASEIFCKFISKMNLGELADIDEEEDDDEPMTWYMGKKIKYSELEKLEREFKENNPR